MDWEDGGFIVGIWQVNEWMPIITKSRADNSLRFVFKNGDDPAATFYMDYIHIIHLTNGIDGILDYVNQAMVKTYKKKVLE